MDGDHLLGNPSGIASVAEPPGSSCLQADGAGRIIWPRLFIFRNFVVVEWAFRATPNVRVFGLVRQPVEYGNKYGNS
jgi:hypothetical protein